MKFSDEYDQITWEPDIQCLSLHRTRYDDYIRVWIEQRIVESNNDITDTHTIIWEADEDGI